MNSRHPVILGLRNVLKTTASYDITTVTLPLLLTNEMTEVCVTLVGVKNLKIFDLFIIIQILLGNDSSMVFKESRTCV